VPGLSVDEIAMRARKFVDAYDTVTKGIAV